MRETHPLKGTLLSPTYGSLKRDLIQMVYIPKGPPNPNSQKRTTMETIGRALGHLGHLGLGPRFRSWGWGNLGPSGSTAHGRCFRFYGFFCFWG